MATTAAANKVRGRKKARLKIYAKLNDQAPHGVEYRHEVNDKPGSDPVKCPKGEGAYEIIFTLHDDTGLGLKFDCGNPFLCDVTVNDACPTKLNSEFSVDDCDAGELRVNNKNNDEATYHYQLNIIDDRGRPRPYDPIIVNGGKTRFVTNLILAIGGAGAVALIGHFLRLWQLW
jgi:hypothetical protein